MGLFSDFYNTVARFFRPQEETGDASKSVATNRLKLVLMQDRTNLTPKVLEQMRSELVDLLSKYLEMDKDLLELNFEQEGEQVALMLSIPVIRAKDEDEIEAINAKTNNEDECEEENGESNEDSSENSDEEDEGIIAEDNKSEEVQLESTDEASEGKNVSTPAEMNSSKKEEVKEECASEK